MSSPPLHWFLPTSGDDRETSEAATAQCENWVEQRREPTIGYLTPDSRAAEQDLALSQLHPTRVAVRGCMAHHGDAVLHDGQVEVPGSRSAPGFYSPPPGGGVGRAFFQRQ